MSRLIAITSLSIFVFLMYGITYSQENTQSHGRELGFGFGFGNASMSVGKSSNSKSGLIIHGHIGIDTNNRFLLNIEINPFKVQSPVLDEAFTCVYSFLSWNLRLKENLYVQPSLGLQFRSWSGDERVTGSDTGLAIGAAIGYEFRFKPRFSLTPEIIYRGALIEAEGNVVTSLVGLQLVGAWHF